MERKVISIKERVMLPGSKWNKHQTLIQSDDISKYLPETELYSERTLEKFLERYPVVFIKPLAGFGGKNIFHVQRRTDGKYLVTMQDTRKVLSSQRAIHAWVVRRGRQQNKKTFLIQKGIDLARYHNRPIDIRAVVQRNESKEWEVSGMSAKVAGQNLAVTNVARGGQIFEVSTCLEEVGFSTEETDNLIQEMRHLTLLVADFLGERYDNAIYGLDIGIDQSRRLWLIEVNTTPALTLFKNAPDHPMNVRTRALYKLNWAINKHT